MVSLSFSWAQQLVRLQILIWNYFCAPGVKPRSGHLFHQRRKFLRMTITDAINPHNSNQGFLSKLGRSNSLFPWWGEGGCREAGGGGWRHKYLLCFREVSCSVLKYFSTKNTHPLTDILNPHMLRMWSLWGIFLLAPLVPIWSIQTAISRSWRPWSVLDVKLLYYSWFLQMTLDLIW